MQDASHVCYEPAYALATFATGTAPASPAFPVSEVDGLYASFAAGDTLASSAFIPLQAHKIIGAGYASVSGAGPTAGST